MPVLADSELHHRLEGRTNMIDETAERDDLDPKGEADRGWPRAVCPMASIRRRFSRRPPSRFLMMLPGVLLLVVGVAILMQPKVLVWLAAGATVLLGAAMLWMAHFMYRLGARVKSASG